MRDWFLHVGLKSTNLIFLRVEVKFLKPTVNKLGKSTEVLFVWEKELINFWIQNCPENLNKNTGDWCTSFDSAVVNIIGYTFFNEYEEIRSKIIQSHQVNFLMFPILKILLLETHRLDLKGILPVLYWEFVFLKFGLKIDSFDGFEKVNLILEIRVGFKLFKFFGAFFSGHVE